MLHFDGSSYDGLLALVIYPSKYGISTARDMTRYFRTEERFTNSRPRQR
jgi:hypothetical protein